MLEVLGVWTKFVSTKLLSLWKGCWMLLTALLGMGASLFLVIGVQAGHPEVKTAATRKRAPAELH